MVSLGMLLRTEVLFLLLFWTLLAKTALLCNKETLCWTAQFYFVNNKATLQKSGSGSRSIGDCDKEGDNLREKPCKEPDLKEKAIRFWVRELFRRQSKG